MSSDELQEFEFRVPKTARYYTLGEVSQNVKHVWWVCHGYGQLARYFLKHFKPLADEHRLIVAPEGLSRFYLDRGEWTRVGASWMTREDRFAEIVDHVAYLNLLFDHITEHLGPNVVHHTLGFSQGTATVWRWINSGHVRPRSICLWAGTLPPEAENIQDIDELNLKVVYGTQDEYINEERMQTVYNILDRLRKPYHVQTFEGGHTIDKATLQHVVEELESNPTY